ncbi:MAG TPA: hypothetical protein VGC41_07175 [Kofleriaceae bacterium]
MRTVREHAEVSRRGDLARAIGDASTTACVLAQARDRVASAHAAVEAAVHARHGLPTATQIALAERFIARQRRNLLAAREAEVAAQLAHDQVEGEVAAARVRLGRARADREVIERHFAKWRTDQARRRENAAD